MTVYQKIKNFILDILFPISCLSCNQDGFWLCEECLEKIEILNFQVCPCCEKIITDQGKLCFGCKSSQRGRLFYLDALIVAAKYNENNISKVIHNFKYNFIRDISVPLGKILIKSLLKGELPLPDFIVPVPLHPKRLRWRGFNQAELLAKHLGQKLTPGFEIPVLNNILVRKKYTQPQMKVKKYQDREINVRNSFIFCSEFSEIIKNKKVLLVDDVATTASTLLECAKILKINGASRVFASVVARQTFESEPK